MITHNSFLNKDFLRMDQAKKLKKLNKIMMVLSKIRIKIREEEFTKQIEIKKHLWYKLIILMMLIF